jgi:hypothetical protein
MNWRLNVASLLAIVLTLIYGSGLCFAVAHKDKLGIMVFGVAVLICGFMSWASGFARPKP